MEKEPDHQRPGPRGIKKIYIDRSVRCCDETAAILAAVDAPHKTVTDDRGVYQDIRSAADPVQTGKQALYITENKGRFIKPCPGTRCYNCCGYQILHIGTFCNMDCAYCILQSYFHPPVMQYFVNHDKLKSELADMFSSGRINRIGTGEFTDSMIWDVWTSLNSRLIPEFARHTNAVLELKTKTTRIDGLRHLPHNGKTIVAWSLNTEKVIREEELGTAPLSERLDAAQRCASWGYPLAFHFDPIIIYDGCEEEYGRVIDRLFSAVSDKGVVWISLGTLRFMPELKPIIENRFPGSKIVYGEFIPGMDQKMRYFKPMRIDLYRKLIARIREWSSDTLIYFCMEDNEVWRKSLGFVPNERGGLSKMLDASAAAHCGLSA